MKFLEILGFAALCVLLGFIGGALHGLWKNRS
jgi:hypothetical protein